MTEVRSPGLIVNSGAVGTDFFWFKVALQEENKMELPVYNEKGEVAGKISFDESVLGEKVKRRLLHDAVVMYEARKRAGTHCTKTRADRKGSNKKPWRQKGTGRARVGNRRSPIWRKGGIIWGPKPRDHGYSMPVKARREALRSALLSKFRDDQVKVIEGLDFNEPKTSRMAGVLKNLGVSKCMLAVKGQKPEVLKSIRNIPRTLMSSVTDLNAYDVLRCGELLFTKDAIESLAEVVKK
jgi:large subunit ribosomal protein L4